MLLWFAKNWGTILVTLILIGIVALAVHTMRKDKREGRSSCGGSCASCHGGCQACTTHNNKAG